MSLDTLAQLGAFVGGVFVPDVIARWERFIAGERPVPSLVPLAATHT